jgi:hypothetical protein
MREAPLNLDGEYPGTVFREDIHLTEHTATQLAHGHIACPRPQLATCHRAYQRYTACHLPHTDRQPPQLTSCHRACQRCTACQLSHSSLMVYRSPTNTACQLPHSSLIVYRSPTTTACQLPQVTNCHPACQLSHSSLRKPTSVRSHRQSPAVNATTASFLGLRQRQRAQDLLREAHRKAPRKALKRVPASQCARAKAKNALLE